MTKYKVTSNIVGNIYINGHLLRYNDSIEIDKLDDFLKRMYADNRIKIEKIEKVEKEKNELKDIELNGSNVMADEEVNKVEKENKKKKVRKHKKEV